MRNSYTSKNTIFENAGLIVPAHEQDAGGEGEKLHADAGGEGGAAF
jgi:hypothetical protein